LLRCCFNLAAHVFAAPDGALPGKADRWFARAVAKARAVLGEQGQHADAEVLDGFTWHCLRHTFASRLAMAGVDLLTLKDLGGWKTLSMVTRYAHLMPGRLREGVERLVATVPAGATSAKAQSNWHRYVAPASPPSPLPSCNSLKDWCPRGESNTRPRV
jgi:hypothetical protein